VTDHTAVNVHQSDAGHAIKHVPRSFVIFFGGKGVDPDPAPSPNKTFNSILLKAEGPKMATREAAKSMTSQQNTTRN